LYGEEGTDFRFDCHWNVGAGADDDGVRFAAAGAHDPARGYFRGLHGERYDRRRVERNIEVLLVERPEAKAF
jgi:hypothetical protein